MSRQVDKKIEELSTRLSNVLKMLKLRQVNFALESKINPGTLSKALERGSLSDDIVDKIYDRFGVRKEYWEDGEQPIIDENHTYVETPSNNPEMSSDNIYQKLVEENSDYRLIPKTILDGEYRIMLESELAERKKLYDEAIASKNKLITQYEKEIEELRAEKEGRLTPAKPIPVPAEQAK